MQLMEKNLNSKITTKAFECPEAGCNKSFSTSSNLTRHLIVHSGSQPFACDRCSKRFNQKGNLVKHLRSHDNAHLRWDRSTEDKPFKCPLCKRSFTVNLSRKHHLVTFHGKSPDYEERNSDPDITAGSHDGDDEDEEDVDEEDNKNENQSTDSCSNGETTTQETTQPHCTSLESNNSDSLSCTSTNSMNTFDHPKSPEVESKTEMPSEVLISKTSSGEGEYMDFMTIKTCMPRNIGKKPAEYRDFILSQFPSLSDEFQEMRYIISRLVWVIEHSDTERVKCHKECILNSATQLKRVLAMGGGLSSQKHAFTFGDFKIESDNPMTDNQRSLSNGNTNTNSILSSASGEKMTAPDNDAFTKLARHFVSAPGYYDPDSMSLDTLSFEGVDADDEIASTSNEAQNNSSCGDAEVSTTRCHCCASRGVFCVPDARSNTPRMAGLYCVPIGDGGDSIILDNMSEVSEVNIQATKKQRS